MRRRCEEEKEEEEVLQCDVPPFAILMNKRAHRHTTQSDAADKALQRKVKMRRRRKVKMRRKRRRRSNTSMR